MYVLESAWLSWILTTVVLSSLSNQEEMDKNWQETTKMYMNHTERFPIFSPKKALILTQEGKEYSDVVRIHES